jgi:hypothetical protein
MMSVGVPGSCVAATASLCSHKSESRTRAMLPGCTRPRPQEPTRQAELVRWQQRDDEKPRAVNNGSGGARWLASAMDPASWLSWSRRTAASSRRRTPRPQPKTHVRQEGGRIRRARGNQPGQVTHRGAAWLAVVWEMTRLQDINIQSLYHTVPVGHVLPPAPFSRSLPINTSDAPLDPIPNCRSKRCRTSLISHHVYKFRASTSK